MILKKKAEIRLIKTVNYNVEYKNEKLYVNSRNITELERTFPIPDKYGIKKFTDPESYAVVILATLEILFESPSEISNEFGVFTTYHGGYMHCFITPENTVYKFSSKKPVIVYRYFQNLYYNYGGAGYVYDLNRKTTNKIHKMTNPHSLARYSETPTTKIVYCSLTGYRLLETKKTNQIMLKGNYVYIFDGNHIKQKRTSVYTEVYKIVRL